MVPKILTKSVCSILPLYTTVQYAALAFGTPAASEAGSVYGSMRGGSMYGSLRGGSIYQAASPASMKRTSETVQRSAEPAYPKGRDFRDSLNDVASAVAFSKSPLPALPGYVGPVPSHYSPPPNKEDMKRTVKEDVAGAHTRLPPSNRTHVGEGLKRAVV